jgi:hypothetical protein
MLVNIAHVHHPFLLETYAMKADPGRQIEGFADRRRFGSDYRSISTGFRIEKTSLINALLQVGDVEL